MNTTSEKQIISFYDYKINYNTCLGKGVFGAVYEIIKRPENEKGYLAWLCPYLYDYVFTVDCKNDIEKTGLCVKISKSALRILYENINHPLPLRRSLYSFFAPSIEINGNRVLQERGLTNIKFYETNSIYSQFKTMVNGHTLEFYLDKGYFTNKSYYELRKTFACFLRLLSLTQGIFFEDVHEKNIMYDEKEHRWEIVDGDIYEEAGSSDTIAALFDFDNLDLYHKSVSVKRVFEKLAKVAKKGSLYTEKTDEKLLKNLV